MLSSNRFLKFDLKKPKCMQHLLSPAPSALSPCVANSSHQFLAASNYTEGFSCLVVSHLRSIHSSQPFCLVLLSHSTQVATGFCLVRCSCQGQAPCLTHRARSCSASWEQDSSSPGNTDTDRTIHP